MAFCDCESTFSNTGTTGCQALLGVAKKIILVPYANGSNVRNGIDLSSIPNAAGITALINAASPLERYYPLPEMENVTNERGDSVTEESPAGTIVKVRNGVKTFTCEMWQLGSVFAGKIESFGCSRVAAYLVDSDDKLAGDKSVAGYLYPIELKNATWDVKTVDATDTTVPKVTLTFQWADSVNDGDISFLTQYRYRHRLNR